MMMEIPVRSDIYWYSENVELNGVQYRFVFHWNTRGQRWYMDILTSDGEMLLAGIPLVVDTPLIKRFTDERLPYGFIMAVDQSGSGEEMELEDLGDRIKLIFATEEDF